MRVGKTALACLIGLALLAPGSALAQKDVKGSKDHPLVGRFAGSSIRIYDAKDFEAYELGLGRLVLRDKAYRWTKSEKLEGKVTRITYVAPKAVSTLAIVRSYEDTLKKAGFELLFATEGERNLNNYERWYDDANPYPEYQRQYLLGTKSQRYLAAKLRRQEGDIYVAVYAATGGALVSDNPKIQLDIVEVKALEGGLVTADTMGAELTKAGRIAIYTIHFDMDKAEIKPESEQTLREIAKLIQQSPGLNLYIVGHTDNIGTLPYNMDLSQRRAEAVVKALTSGHGVEPARLRSAGVGPLTPVAQNKTDDGRAKNRRVELVAQ